MGATISEFGAGQGKRVRLLCSPHLAGKRKSQGIRKIRWPKVRKMEKAVTFLRFLRFQRRRNEMESENGSTENSGFCG